MTTTTPPRRGLRAALLAVVAAAALLLVPVGPTGAQEEPGPDAFDEGTALDLDSRIVGGTQAASGAWPTQVGLLQAGVADNYQAQFCGGTLIAPTWVLTAGHCVLDSGWNPGPGGVDVLVGTQNLGSGGTRIDVAQIIWYPTWTPSTSENDVALLRLASAVTSISPQAYIGQGGALSAGTDLTATGWGNTNPGGSSYPTLLRQVTVDQYSNTQCSNAYGSSYKAGSMTCAGVPGGGKDTCQGDSGGPLFYRQGSVWVQMGVTSWGAGCAAAQYPGVYARVATYTNWINRTIRKYGGHSDANTFVRQSYLDTLRRQPTASELQAGASSLNLNTRTPGKYASDLVQGSAYQQRTGGVARLYSAFFLRNPDTAGLAYWWQQVNTGRSLQRIANIMAESSEFIDRYGSLTNGQYVDLVYENVLDRAPDSAGRAYWLGELNAGRKTRGEMMAGFSESAEYRTANKARVDVIISFFGYVRRVPTAGELSTWRPQSNVALTTMLIASATYYNRFS